MCWHKWGKWGNQKDEVWTITPTIHGIPIGEPFAYTKVSQTRICEKCGKIKRRFI